MEELPVVRSPRFDQVPIEQPTRQASVGFPLALRPAL